MLQAVQSGRLQGIKKSTDLIPREESLLYKRDSGAGSRSSPPLAGEYKVLEAAS